MEEDQTLDQPLQLSLLSMRLTYDVFLSFRGVDTRRTFTEPLRVALDRQGVRAFIDNEGLRCGDEIAPGLLQAINDSSASVAVISPRYADSRWCLEELATLFESRKLVIPVFYHVDPSEVRHQSGTFGHNFRIMIQQRSVEEKKVMRWKQALEMVGNQRGFHVTPQSGNSGTFQMIVKRVLEELHRIPVDIAAYPVGLRSRRDNVISILNSQDNASARFIGIHGQPGIGKTTLAKAVFNKLAASFKRRCFFPNLKEALEKEGIHSIQNKLLRDLSLQATHHLCDEDSRNSIVRSLISNDDPVLLVLDDVVRVEKLKELGIHRKWFSEGSRFIATSRDIKILRSFVREDELYEVEELLESEACELFSYHASRRKEPTKEFASLYKTILSLIGRLPLAIEVFGSMFLDKRTKREWETTLENMSTIHPPCLQDLLKTSYDELDGVQKCIFLDIACLFVQVGMKKVDAINIFRGCGLHAEEAVQKLVKKSLLKITTDDVLWMHDQIRDMGRQIVMQEDHEKPGNRSRLWKYDDGVNVLKNNKGTKEVRGIILDNRSKKSLTMNMVSKSSFLQKFWINRISQGSQNAEVCTVLFQPLDNLKLLQINDVNIQGEFNYMVPDLRWLKWKECPWKYLPSTLPPNISVLDLSKSELECLWVPNRLFIKKNQVLKNLTVLNLSNSYNLKSLPDLFGHCNLRKLILEGCVKLREIHDSVGHLNSLLHLNLRRCTSLVALPSDISGLKHLEELILSNCSALTSLPCDWRNLKSVKELHLDQTGVTMLPNLYHLTSLELMILDHCTQLELLDITIGNMQSLKVLSLYNSGVTKLPDSIGRLQSLRHLNLGNCLSLKNIPDSVGEIKSLSILHLTNSPITQLPDSCCPLPYLQSLFVAQCPLQYLTTSTSGLSSIVELHLNGSKIIKLPDEIGSLKFIQTLEMGNCTSLVQLPESIGGLSFLSKLNLERTSIKELPGSIGGLENLTTLILNECRNLCKLPNSFGELKSLYHLWMEETSITELPITIGNLSKLVILMMKKKENPIKEAQLPGSFGNLSHLQEFDAGGWNISGIPENFKMLTSMQTLDLGYNSFTTLPANFEDLWVLQKLHLPHCQNLEFLPSLPSSLIELNAANCSALSYLHDISNLIKLVELQLTDCGNLQDVPGLEHLRSLRRVYMAGCNASASTVRERLSKEICERLSYLGIPGSQIPDWFSKEVDTYSNRMKSALKSIIIGIVLSVKTDKLKNDLASSPLAEVEVKIIRTGCGILETTPSLIALPSTSEDQLYLCRIRDFHPLPSLLEDSDKIEVSLLRKYDNGVELKTREIHLVYETDEEK